MDIRFLFFSSQDRVPRTATKLILKSKSKSYVWFAPQKEKVISLPHLGVDEIGVPKQPGKPVSNPSDQVLPSTKLLGPKLGHTTVMAWVQ